MQRACAHLLKSWLWSSLVADIREPIGRSELPGCGSLPYALFHAVVPRPSSDGGRLQLAPVVVHRRSSEPVDTYSIHEADDTGAGCPGEPHSIAGKE